MTNDVTKTLARPAWAAELNDQQWLFVEAYVDTLNGSQCRRLGTRPMRCHSSSRKP
jgi:hypothetical protein